MNLLKINPTRITRRSSKLLLTGALLLGASSVSGCNSAGEGMFSGAALGALTGVALGSLSGNAGEGAIAGTIIGAAGGAILGDQNERNRNNARYGNYSTGGSGWGSSRGSTNIYYGGRSHGYDGGYRSKRHHSYRHHGYDGHGSWWEEDWHH